MAILESMMGYYPKWRELVAWATKADASTLENLTSREIAGYFEALSPFRIGKGAVLNVRMSFWHRGLSTINRVSIARKMWAGTEWEKKQFQLTDGELVRFLREYGKQVVPLVRREIQSEMQLLVHYLDQIEEYPYLESVKEFESIQIIHRDGIEYVKKIEADNWNPGLIKVTPVTSGTLYVNIYNAEHLELLEQIHDELVEFFSYCYKKKVEIKEHNSKILAKMKETVLPFLVAKGLAK